MKLLAVAADIGSTIADIRLATPLQALTQRSPGWQLRLRSLPDCGGSDLEWADVLVLQRPASRRAWQLQAAMQRSGGCVLVDIDDLLTDMPATLLHCSDMHKRQRWLRRSLAAADAVSVSTQRLGLALMPLMPPRPPMPMERRWSVVPNHGAGPALLPRARVAGPVHFVFVSSDHVPVLAVAQALRGLEQGRHWQVVAIGPVADDLAAHGVAVLRQAPMPRPAFTQWLRTLPNAVAVIPLGDTPFDACKSAIKFFDHALAGVPVLAAALPPYSDAITHGRSGLLVDGTAGAWQTALRTALDDAPLLQRLAAAAASDVLASATLDHTVAAWQTALALVAPRRQPARPAWSWWQRACAPLLAAVQRANRVRLARRRARLSQRAQRDQRAGG